MTKPTETGAPCANCGMPANHDWHTERVKPYHVFVSRSAAASLPDAVDQEGRCVNWHYCAECGLRIEDAASRDRRAQELEDDLHMAILGTMTLEKVYVSANTERIQNLERAETAERQLTEAREALTMAECAMTNYVRGEMYYIGALLQVKRVLRPGRE